MCPTMCTMFTVYTPNNFVDRDFFNGLAMIATILICVIVVEMIGQDLDFLLWSANSFMVAFLCVLVLN